MILPSFPFSSSHICSVDRALIDEIKSCVSLADIVREDGHELRRAGQNDFKCHCPFHSERTPSCHVNATRLKCFGCGVHHDVVAYWEATRGRHFPEAIKQLAARAGVILPDTTDTGTKRTTCRPSATPPKPAQKGELENPLPPDFHDTHRHVRWTAYQDADAQADVASKLGIRGESVRDLTVPIACALGWSREPIAIETANGTSHSRPRRITYCHCHGIKVRAPYGDDRNPRFIWSCGRAVHPWRACIMGARPRIKRVILTEGESDLCAAFDAGWEKLNPLPGEIGRVLVAGALGFNAEWIPLFAGRRVLVAFDADKAGEQGAEKVAGMLSPVAASVEILDHAAI